MADDDRIIDLGERVAALKATADTREEHADDFREWTRTTLGGLADKIDDGFNKVHGELVDHAAKDIEGLAAITKRLDAKGAVAVWWTHVLSRGAVVATIIGGVAAALTLVIQYWPHFAVPK